MKPSSPPTAFQRTAPAIILTVGAGLAFAQPPQRQPYQVTVRDHKPVVSEAVLPLDPTPHLQYTVQGMGVSVRGEQGQTLHLSHFPTFKIDDQLHLEGQGGQVEFTNRPLPPGRGRKGRQGFQSAAVFGDLRVTVTVTLSATKATRGSLKRRLDAVTVHYLVENRGRQAHRFGLRVYMDVFIVNNDGALFAAPTEPGKILNGVVLEGKKFPPYLQLLQVPDLKNPGFVAHLTTDLGSRLEKPDRLVLTRFAEGLQGWDVRALASFGDSALALFWDPRAVPPGGKREFAYGYGQGITTPLEGEGRVQLALGGSFEPGKRFSITAYVTDPAPGQSLALELSGGAALLEGARRQPVPEPPDEGPTSVVRWEGRVLRPGPFTLRVHSSTGVTEGKTVTVTPARH